MCGPTQAQDDLSSEETSFYKTLEGRDATEFGEQQQILMQMQSMYAPILAQGPNQYGYTPAEENTLDTQAGEGVAQNFAQAKKAQREQQSSEGGGDSYLPSGVDAQQSEELDSSAAAQRAAEQLQIKQSGYQQGYNEFTQATTALDTAAGLENPNAGANAATSAGESANSEANAIAAENEAWMAPLAGVVGGVAGAATSG